MIDEDTAFPMEVLQLKNFKVSYAHSWVSIFCFLTFLEG